jgi:hypothetical protein
MNYHLYARRPRSFHDLSKKPKCEGFSSIQATLQNVRGEIMFLPTAEHFESPEDFRCVTPAVSSVRQSSTEELQDRPREVLHSIVSEVAWSFWQSYSDFPAEPLRRNTDALAQRLGLT